MPCALFLLNDATFVRPAIRAHRQQHFIIIVAADGHPTSGPLGDIVPRRIELLAA
jgi:hypothetical protein